jgi:hypothetical protein
VEGWKKTGADSLKADLYGIYRKLKEIAPQSSPVQDGHRSRCTFQRLAENDSSGKVLVSI